jgi:hypothetical protein
MQSAYSYNGTRIHLVIDDDVAAAYNRAQDAFFEAQKLHKQLTGSDWTPTDMLRINWTDEEQKAWNGVAAVINAMCALNGDGIDVADEMTSDYLVKL